MSQYQEVLIERDEGLLTLRLNRPDKLNALTGAMYLRLAEVLQAAAEDARVRAVLLAGSDSCFTSGNDLADFLAAPPSGPDSPVRRFMRALAAFPKPLVAAVNGPAVGIGSTLLLHCDLVYVGRHASLRMPFVALGLCPEFGASLLLPQRIGRVRAAELLLLGEALSGERAAEWGLANAALEDGAAVFEHARGQALRFAALAPQAVATSKRLLKAPQAAALEAVIEAECVLFAERLRSPEAVEALSVFLRRSGAAH